MLHCRMFGYDGQRRTLADSVGDGTKFEVHLWEYEGDCDPEIPLAAPLKRVSVMHEQLHVQWDTRKSKCCPSCLPVGVGSKSYMQ